MDIEIEIEMVEIEMMEIQMETEMETEAARLEREFLEEQQKRRCKERERMDQASLTSLPTFFSHVTPHFSRMSTTFS